MNESTVNLVTEMAAEWLTGWRPIQGSYAGQRGGLREEWGRMV